MAISAKDRCIERLESVTDDMPKLGHLEKEKHRYRFRHKLLAFCPGFNKALCLSNTVSWTKTRELDCDLVISSLPPSKLPSLPTPRWIRCSSLTLPQPSVHESIPLFSVVLESSVLCIWCDGPKSSIVSCSSLYPQHQHNA